MTLLKYCPSLLPAAMALLLSGFSPLASGLDPAQPTLKMQGATPTLGRFLPVEQAFALEYGWASPTELSVRWSMPDGYYLYRKHLKFISDDFAQPKLPAGQEKTDEFFGLTEVYHHLLEVRLPLLPLVPGAETSSDDGSMVTVKLVWQGCAEAGLCYPPEQKILRLPRPGTQLTADITNTAYETRAPALAEDQQLSRQLMDGHLIWNLALFFVFGLLLAFTPCVLPMIPILSGLIAGAGNISQKRSVLLTLVYVLAMALTYAVAGVLAASAGSSLQASLQQPWILGSFSALMVALALAMFGLYELQLPASIQNWLNSRSRNVGGNLWVAGTMGVLSALIVGPCVAPPLVGALVYIGHTGNALLGGAVLFSMGLGMGVPLLLVGTSLGRILPRAGAWMVAIKQGFGLMLLGLALWFLERIISTHIAAGLWALLALAAAVWMALLTLRAAKALFQAQEQRRFAPAGVLLLGLGATLLLAVSMYFAAQATGINIRIGSNAEATKPFVADYNIHSLAEFQQIQASADRPVVLDYYADWCVECIQMERQVFPASRVQSALESWIFVRADITANDQVAKELLRSFNVVGPPTLLFFDRNGSELRQLRAVGIIDQGQLLERLRL
ncbi:MAG: protein-disulfide reductase DsbD [Gammaproteobacteria bacterium]